MARTKEGRMIEKQLKQLVEKIDFSSTDGWKVLDWRKAAMILKEKDPHVAYAFLNKQRDTSRCRIWLNHQPYTNDYALLASRWDIPMLEIDGNAVECYVNPYDMPLEFQKRCLSDGTVTILPEKRPWDMHTLWPDSALIILGLQTNEQQVLQKEQRACEQQDNDEEWRAN